MKLDRLNLPTGRTTLWFEEMNEISIEAIFGSIKNEHILEHETVTLIYNKHGLRNERKENVEQYCIQNGWNFHHGSHFFGCEAQVIILFECSLLFELISRGRTQVIMITNNK